MSVKQATEKTEKQAIPEGYKLKHDGSLVPLTQIKELDLMRDELVGQIAATFISERAALSSLKQVVLGEIATFLDISAEQYNVKRGGKKGNVTLMSFDGRYKVAMQIAEYIIFDERLQVAKDLIDACIHDWSNGADDKILTLVNDAFQVDKQGNVSTARILGLRRLKIDDEQWQQAMLAIADSMSVSGSKTYVRVYERVGQEDKWQVISLDFSALEVA